MRNSKTELTEVKRQSLDSNVLKVATLTRIEGKPYVPSVTIPDFKLAKSKTEFVDDFKSAIKNGEDAVMIVATNNERIAMNNVARNEKFGAEKTLLNEGDVMISVANSTAYPNSEMFEVDRINDSIKQEIVLQTKDGKSLEYDGFFTNVVTKDGKNVTMLHIPLLDKPSFYHAQLMQYARSNSDFMGFLESRGLVMATKKGAKLSPALVIATYGYAVTAHKSQGSQWSKVFVNQNYVSPNWNSARWYYTAITRSSKDVIVLNTGNNVSISEVEMNSKLDVATVPSQPVKKKELFSPEKGIAQKSFRGKSLNFVDKIPTNKETVVAMSNNRQTGVISIDSNAMFQKFRDKAWTKPAKQLDGSFATPLAENEFETFDEWFTFALIHEVKHDSIFKQEGETTGEYEDRINQAALADIKANYNIPTSKIQPEGLPSIDNNNKNNCG